MSLKVYWASVCSSTEMRKRQERIFSVLDSNQIWYAKVDITQDPADKDKMRELAGNPTALPPQICKGDVYCGDYTAFDNAIECDALKAFLKL